MKTTFRNLALAGTLMLAGTAAHAVPMVWTDSMDFGQRYVGIGDVFGYTHDIRDGVNGYNPGPDSVESYKLSINLGDDDKGFDEYLFQETAVVWVGIQPVTFTFGNPDAGYSFTGHVQLDLFGTLSVFVSSGFSDFYVKSSYLTVNGNDAGGSTRVPEPATLGLLGLGLLGVGFAARRRKA